MSDPAAMTVMHLVGSPVDAFHADLSRLYASGCLRALEASGDQVNVVAYVSPGGGWSFPSDLSASAIAGAPTMTPAQALGRIETFGVDLVLPQMFCLPGMTSYRAMFDVLGIDYVGNRPEVMAVAADKTAARALVAAAGVAVPAGEVVTRGESPTLAPPVVVKPPTADNSVGVTYVDDPIAMNAAVDEASTYGPTALVEAYVPLGREVRCGIVVRDGELVCLPLEEYGVNPMSKPIRSGADKLDRSADGDLYLVAKDAEHAWIVDHDDPIVDRVHAAARACHKALGCRHYSLFDFRIDPAGDPWFLEAGPYCSYAPGSVITTMAAAAGIDLPELFAVAVRELRSEKAR